MSRLAPTPALPASVTGAGVILLYHRVARHVNDPCGLAVRPRYFARHMRVLRRRVRVVPLAELADDVAGGDGDARVAVTFDDGYADNLLNAAPVLAAEGVPATVFVATGMIGSRREPWWDDLERLLLSRTELPRVVRLSVNGVEHRWECAGAEKRGWRDVMRQRRWCVWHESDPTPRHRMYRELSGLLRPLGQDAQHSVLEELARLARRPVQGRRSHRWLTADEVARLAGVPGIELGAHTVSHVSLAHHPPAVQRREIEESKAALESMIGREVTSFAYPFGGRGAYTAETVGLVREAGFRRACSAAGGAVTAADDRFDLPRVSVGDWPSEEFERRLARWLTPARKGDIPPF
jgi:peptidoglycan/xylan/chitin deacetylase (PgdA/CDA1 family)